MLQFEDGPSRKSDGFLRAPSLNQFSMDVCRKGSIFHVNALKPSNGTHHFSKTWLFRDTHRYSFSHQISHPATSACFSGPLAQGLDNRVLVCPLCNKGVRLEVGEDANLTWERTLVGRLV